MNNPQRFRLPHLQTFNTSHGWLDLERWNRGVIYADISVSELLQTDNLFQIVSESLLEGNL